MPMMHNHPHLQDAHGKALDLLAQAGDDQEHVVIVKLLLDVLQELRAHDDRITKVEDGFANGDPPGHRKVHERHIEKANLANEDRREIKNKVLIAVIGAGVLWLIQTAWQVLAKALLSGGVR